MLLVQLYLQDHTFKELQEQHGVYSSFSKCGSFWSMNYDQIEAKDDDLLSQQCRGLILAHSQGKSFLPAAQKINDKLNYSHICPQSTIVVCRGFDRFFNEGQGAAAKINWNDPNLKVYNKEDGTLVLLWFNPFNNCWNVATRSCPEANLPLMGYSDLTFRSLFERAILKQTNITFAQFVYGLDYRNTYLFELCSPYNRVVVNYDETNVFFIGAREVNSGHELDIENPLFDAQLHGLSRARTYALNNLSQVIDYVSNFNPTANEGVVIKDSQFNRIKIKNPQYLALNKLRDQLAHSARNCLELILSGKDDDALSFLPSEIARDLIAIKMKFVLWLKEQENLYQAILNQTNSILPNDRKTFALTSNQYNNAYKTAFFAIFSGKAVSVRNFIDNSRKNGTWADNFLDAILTHISK